MARVSASSTGAGMEVQYATIPATATARSTNATAPSAAYVELASIFEALTGGAARVAGALTCGSPFAKASLRGNSYATN